MKKPGILLIIMMTILLMGCNVDNPSFIEKGYDKIMQISGNPVTNHFKVEFRDGQKCFYYKDLPVSGWVETFNSVGIKSSDINYTRGIPNGEFIFYNESGKKYLKAALIREGNIYVGKIFIGYDDKEKIELNGKFKLTFDWITDPEVRIGDRSPEVFARDVFQQFCIDGEIENDILFHGVIKNGVKSGKWLEKYDDGQQLKYERNYTNGVKDGFWAEYTQDGNVLCKGNYINGVKSGYWEEKDDDFYRSEKGTYLNGKKNGYWEETVGGVYRTGNYIQGLKQGIWQEKFFSPGNSSLYIGEYDNGVQKGIWKYFEDGYLQREDNYGK